MIFPEAMTELSMYKEFRKAVGVPILANITEFGHTPLFTRDELASVDVDMILYCCGAYRAMNAAALKVYQAIREQGTQKDVVPIMVNVTPDGVRLLFPLRGPANLQSAPHENPL
jgi:methylisocitrate lyase